MFDKKAYMKVWRATHQEQMRGYLKVWRETQPERNKELKKKWELENPEKVKEMYRKSGKKYRMAHPERVAVMQRRHYLANYERKSEYSKKWRLANLERDKIVKKKWRLEHPGYSSEHSKKYGRTLKGKEVQRKARAKSRAKRRRFGFVPLNKYFKDSEGHHINLEEVIYIPKKMHRSVWHSILSGVNMEKINRLAFNYLHSEKEKTS